MIDGIDHFTGAEVKATDLRAGAAMILAALAAEGETMIDGVRRGIGIRFIKSGNCSI